MRLRFASGLCFLALVELHHFLESYSRTRCATCEEGGFGPRGRGYSSVVQGDVVTPCRYRVGLAVATYLLIV